MTLVIALSTMPANFNPEVFASRMRIPKAVEGSVLRLSVCLANARIPKTPAELFDVAPLGQFGRVTRAWRKMPTD
jgi:hypothetical protein